MNCSNQSSKSCNEHCPVKIYETPNRITAKLNKMMNFKNLLIGDRNKILIVGVLSIMVLFLVAAQTQQELEQELEQLEQDLVDAGYGKQEKTMFAGGGE